MTYSVFLRLLFNKEDMGEHVALLTVITTKITGYTKNLSPSKLLLATSISTESTTESLKRKKSSIIRLPSCPYAGLKSFGDDVPSCL